ncbi:MAG: translation initiation factor [Verrucomicrobiaceae bacterium]|nr:translation initiation factor [Verrucomicrobiaceae bacterium]
MSLVYSTDKGRLCPTCSKPVAVCDCKNKTNKLTASGLIGDGIVRLQRQTQGRAGKAVVVISGLALAGEAIKDLAKTLKQRCGCGGAVKGDTIEIQGDHRETLKTELERLGYKVKIAGG